jgi:hypothetical protein
LADPLSRAPAFDTSLGVADSDDLDMSLGGGWGALRLTAFLGGGSYGSHFGSEEQIRWVRTGVVS